MQASPFAKSMLWKRRAVPQLIGVLGRQCFVDYEAAMEVFDRGAKSSAFELSWQTTGEQLYTVFITAMLHGASVGQKAGGTSLFLPSDRIQIRDWTGYDLELAAMVMSSGCRVPKPPTMSYAGIVYGAQSMYLSSHPRVHDLGNYNA